MNKPGTKSLGCMDSPYCCRLAYPGRPWDGDGKDSAGFGAETLPVEWETAMDFGDSTETVGKRFGDVHSTRDTLIYCWTKFYFKKQTFF